MERGDGDGRSSERKGAGAWLSCSRRERLRVITVIALPIPDRFPLCDDLDNPFRRQSDEVRIQEVVDICGAILAQCGLNGGASPEMPRAA